VGGILAAGEARGDDERWRYRQSKRNKRNAQMIEAMRQGERDRAWLEQHPGVLEPYRGEWVVIYEARVVAHSPDGREVARQASARLYPGSTLLYVPTLEESAGIRVGPFR
jgi:hypothetical protein